VSDSEAQGKGLRTIDIISMLSPKALWRILRGMVRAPLDEHFVGHPLAVCWFTNFSCNARCHFCCKAAEIRAGRDRFPPPDLDRAKKLMEKIRATVKLLYLSGGEPTIHPDILEILKEARRIDFHSVGMSSNIIALDRQPEILEYLDAISVSIHSPDVENHAANLGVPVKTAERVFANLEMLREYRKGHDIKVIINCVINRKNLDSVIDMVDFTGERDFLLEIVPANEKDGAPKDLAGNAEYEVLIERLMELRDSGEAPHLAGSSHYYRRIKSFEPFRCFPYGVPNIMPDGRLCTPCDNSGQYAVNVLDHEDLKAAVKASLPYLGEYPCREGKCFKAGIIERSRLFGLLVSGGLSADPASRGSSAPPSSG